MKVWRRTFAVVIISVGSIVVWTIGADTIRTTQYARANETVQLARQQLATVQDLATVYKTVGRAVEPSVVKIDVHRTIRTSARYDDLLRQFFPDLDGDGDPDIPEDQRRQLPGFEAVGTGSGVIMEVDGSSGYIVTNNHVAGNATEMTITLHDGREIKNARLLGADPKSDLAVIRIEADGLIAAEWGNSDYLEKGDLICAFGSPFGYVGSMTHGIVSALNRDRVRIINSPYAYENFIQVDAPINPGNSGGPLVNLRGEVVGINTAIASRTGSFAGIGFAIPSNQARFVYDQIKGQGRVVRGWLGVEIDNVRARKELARESGYEGEAGVLVNGVQREAPAAGILEPGDVILGIDGKKIDNMSELRNLIAATPPGTELKLDIHRAGKAQQVPITLGEQPDETPAIAGRTSGRDDAARTVEQVGMRLVSPTPATLERAGIPDRQQGALVISILPGSPADQAGLQVGDLIMRVGGEDVSSPSDVNDAISAANLSRGVRLHIVNKNGTRVLFLRTSSR